jgi:protein gp37
MAMRFTGHFNVTCHPNRLEQPLHWKKHRRIFVCSMGDLFHEDVPTKFIEKVMLAIYNNPQHTFLILTKRPDRLLETRVRNFFLNCFMNKTDNIWLGITAETQGVLDRRIEIILEVKKLMQTLPIFVSIEPMLGRINFRWAYWHPVSRTEPTGEYDGLKDLDWVIVGAESGPKRRECKLEWVRDVVRQCKAAGVPIFVKQLHIQPEKCLTCGGDPEKHDMMCKGRPLRLSKNMDEWPEDLRVREWPE